MDVIKSKKLFFAIILLIALLIYIALKQQLVLIEVILSIVQGLILFIFLISEENKRRTVLFLLFASTLIISLFLFVRFPDKLLFTPSGFEKNLLIERQEYYKKEAGFLYQRKLGKYYFNNLKFIIDKLNIKSSYLYDTNRYFLSDNPVLFDYLLLANFFLGFVFLLAQQRDKVIAYLLIIWAVGLFTELDKSIILFLSFVGAVSVFGFISLYGVLIRNEDA
jgi:hypothetical protein